MAVQSIPRRKRSGLASALVITRRELRDSLKDWRIVTPIVILTLIFPFLMDFTSRWATNWVSRFTDPILVERINPFLLMIVGFFPISFSLIIALESFVGEKERNSIEPILSMPLTDLELYMGKMLSSLMLPLLASYLGITVFLVSRFFTSPPWVPPLELTLLMFMLNTVEALVMVSGAVVISSQTTSVRAANLLASFIIIPMALLIQAQSIVMFYAEYRALWWFVIALLVVDLILIRMGIRIFNREDILSKELDELHLRNIWRDFKGYFLRPPELARKRGETNAAKFNLLRFYRHDIPYLLKDQTPAFSVILIVVVSAIILGSIFAQRFPIPAGVFPLENISPETFTSVQKIQFLPEVSTSAIFFNNVRVIVLAGIISIFSFGSLTLILTLINAGLVSFLIAQVVQLNHNPWIFMGAFILPHGIFEIPAIIIGMAFALRIGAALISPPRGFDIGQALLLTTANFLKVLIFLVVPLLLVAGYIEANITPQIVLAIYGGG
ncbi:MAG: stage II sporulation protein M [Anaerolineae bacterium]|nr:stage II sporulation protein M [Anaerolineae bacterium]MCB9106025.1 stage II sporulation protein M [Anaerolineales bacterium]